MSTPFNSAFVPGQRILVLSDQNNGSLIDESPPNPNEDKSYHIVAQLHKSVIEQNIEKFIEVYETQYISNDSVYNHFHFGDQSPYDDFNTYSLCSCPNKDEEPCRINKYMYRRACSCVNGKRYLAYLCAFNEGTHNCYHINHLLDMSTPIKEYLLQDGPIDLEYINTIHYTPAKHM